MKMQENLSTALKRHFDSRLEGMRQDRYSFWAHWAQLAEVFLPRRYKWFISPNQTNRGSAMNQSIIDETGIVAARTLASGMMSSLTSPTRPWFRLGLPGLEETDFGPVKTWLSECQEVMYRVLGESNFYQGMATIYPDVSVFGSAAMIIYEDKDEVIRAYNPGLGEFFFGVDDRLEVDTLYREFTMTVKQACDKFGEEALSDNTRQQYKQGGSSWQNELVVCHGIEPNTELYDADETRLSYAVPKKFAFREVYWEKGSSQGTYSLLDSRGFDEKPFVSARWDLVANDAYGRSPGMDALPATRQLQIQQRRKAEAIDKMVRPPMNASVNMKNEPVSILPGAVNYVADLASSGFKPAYTVEPRLAEMIEDIAETQKRVQGVFFVDLFMMISQLDTVRTATEIDARREEKLIQLGPVIERFENEVLDPLIDRVFAILSRRGLFPPAPPQIHGAKIEVEYVSMLAEAQRAASTASIERLLQLVGGLVGVFPDAGDNIDVDMAIETYADLLGCSPEIIRPEVMVIALRQQKAQAMQQQQQAETAQKLAVGAQTLSKTDVGGGINALQAMLGNGTPGQNVTQ